MNLRSFACLLPLLYLQSLLLCPAQTGTLTYPLKDNLDLREGTLECWVQFGVNVADFLPATDYKTLAVLFAFEGEKGTMAASHFVGSIFGADKGGWYFRPGPKPMLLPVSAAAMWKKGDWHHVAFTWKEKLMRLYMDGKEAGQRDQQASLQESFQVVTDQLLMFGDKWHVAGRFALDDVRVSTIARPTEELGFHVGELKPDPYTSLLDPFECDFVPDGAQLTQPRAILAGTGGKPSKGCRFVDGKFGKALSFYPP
jgi:hypothetical protein